MVRRIKGGIKRSETDPASNLFPKCSSQPRTNRDSQSSVEEKRGREEIKATWWRKRSVKRGESNQASDLTLK